MSCCLWLLFISLPFSIGQDISEAPVIKSDADTDFIKPFRVSVNVSEVRIGISSQQTQSDYQGHG